MLARTCFRRIAERLINRTALVPIGKLICVVLTPGLTGLAAGDEHDGLVPIAQVGDETHGWAVVLCCCARAIDRAGLRLVGDTQKLLEPTCSGQPVEHIEGVKLLSSPIVDA